jgi:hypothetical protein
MKSGPRAAESQSGRDRPGAARRSHDGAVTFSEENRRMRSATRASQIGMMMRVSSSRSRLARVIVQERIAKGRKKELWRWYLRDFDPYTIVYASLKRDDVKVVVFTMSRTLFSKYRMIDAQRALRGRARFAVVVT